MKTLSHILIVLILVIGSSCSHKQVAVQKETVVSPAQFIFDRVSWQPDGLHVGNDESFSAFMKILKGNPELQLYLAQQYTGSTSFWDCGEFVSSKYKLELPHPPKPKEANK